MDNTAVESYYTNSIITSQIFDRSVYNGRVHVGLGGFVTFSVLGHLAARLRVSVPDVVQSGPGLVFTVYPEVLGLLPLAPLWALVHFSTFVLYFVPLYHSAYIMYTR